MAFNWRQKSSIITEASIREIHSVLDTIKTPFDCTAQKSVYDSTHYSSEDDTKDYSHLSGDDTTYYSGNYGRHYTSKELIWNSSWYGNYLVNVNSSNYGSYQSNNKGTHYGSENANVDTSYNITACTTDYGEHFGSREVAQCTGNRSAQVVSNFSSYLSSERDSNLTIHYQSDCSANYGTHYGSYNASVQSS